MHLLSEMCLGRLLLQLLLVVIGPGVRVQAFEYKYEIISIDVAADTPEIVNISDARRQRLGSYNYSISGIIDIHQELTDALILDFFIDYSRTYDKSSNDNFQPTTAHLENNTLTQFAERVYERFMKHVVRKCLLSDYTLPAPFQPPAPTGHLVFEHCMPTRDMLPTYVKTGFYKATLQLSGQASGFFVAILKVIQF